MSQQRISMINEEIRKEISSKIRTLKDPRVQNAMISVTSVETSGDLRYAKVFISVLEKEKTKDVLKGLKSAGGFLRREVGSRLQLRCTPELTFVEDESFTRGMRMYDLLSSLKTSTSEQETETDEASES